MASTKESLTAAQAVQALDAIPGDDPEAMHGAADDILLAYVPPSVQAAYTRVVDRAVWLGGRMSA